MDCVFLYLIIEIVLEIKEITLNWCKEESKESHIHIYEFNISLWIILDTQEKTENDFANRLNNIRLNPFGSREFFPIRSLSYWFYQFSP